jgi:DnaJ-domain-containing protein 1
MSQFHETLYLFSLPLPLRKIIDLVVESVRKAQWSDPGYGQTAKTFFKKIDYQQGKILLIKKDLQGRPLQNKHLGNGLITILIREKKPLQYSLLIRSEDSSLLPMRYNYDNVMVVKKAISQQVQLLKQTQIMAPKMQAKVPPPVATDKKDPLISEDFHRILGVKKGASHDEITQAYLAAIKKNHPDKMAGMAPEFIRLAEERTQKINAAYANLKRQNRER